MEEKEKIWYVKEEAWRKDQMDETRITSGDDG